MKKIHLLLKSVVVLGVAFLLHSCAVNPVTGKKQVMLVSEGRELAMGKEYNPQVIATMGLYDDSKLQEFIDSKGNEMARISHRPNLKYKFQIVNSPVVNAFAVPGGYVYFTRGIMAHFNSEAEFMGVLGHELGHITARHSAAQQTKQILSQVGMVGGMIFAPQLMQQYGGLFSQGIQLLRLKHSRTDESQSDHLGVEYSSKVGYDAQKMAGFFQVLKRLQLRDHPNGIPTYLSTHPDPANRYNAVQQDATTWQQKMPSKDYKVNRNSYLRMIDGIVFGDDPREGYVENSVFYHPDMKFKYPVPRGWKFNNTPQQVQMAPQDGKALMIFAFAGKGDLNSAAQKVLQQMKLQVKENKQTTVNGFPALVTISSQMQRTQTGQMVESIRVLSTFIKDGKTVFMFHGVAPPNTFGSYYTTFENTMKGYARVRDYSKLNRKPDRICVKTVTRGTTLEQALHSFGVKQSELNNIAILNNMNLTDRVAAGTLIKTVGK